MIAPRRFEVFPAIVQIPPDVIAWADCLATAHEEEWGFDDDVGISWPLCGWRGSVGMHIDNEMDDGSLIIGLILEGDQHLVCGVTGEQLPLGVGTLYILDPMSQHGTLGDGRLLFLTDSIALNDTTEPMRLAERLLAAGQHHALRNPTL